MSVDDRDHVTILESCGEYYLVSVANSGGDVNAKCEEDEKV